MLALSVLTSRPKTLHLGQTCVELMEKHEIINHFIETTWLGHKKLFANSSFWDLRHKLQTHWNSYLLPQWLIDIIDVNGKLMWIRKSIGRYWFPIVWSKSIELRELIRSDWKGVQTGQKGSPASHLLLHRLVHSQLGTESAQQTYFLSRHISRHIYTPDILSVILTDIFPDFNIIRLISRLISDTFPLYRSIQSNLKTDILSGKCYIS